MGKGRVHDTLERDRHLHSDVLLANPWRTEVIFTMDEFEKPVHLYVKTHLLTGLKYFGRTTEDPHEYSGSGAYWKRHLAIYGSDVETQVLGTFYDEESLHATAAAFSAQNGIVGSAEWANLLSESGDSPGEGWSRKGDHTEQIAALDAAVEERLARISARAITPGRHNVPSGDRRFG